MAISTSSLSVIATLISELEVELKNAERAAPPRPDRVVAAVGSAPGFVGYRKKRAPLQIDLRTTR
ncbi:hypothetical protein [Mycobacterium marinum]|uniref:hypothetical protein n=1 Tax=Mycobacterium marinum TaxID=1781 RepID=UPI00059C7822|nr:hypothetical protein [Mycobacterium marinum]